MSGHQYVTQNNSNKTATRNLELRTWNKYCQKR